MRSRIVPALILLARTGAAAAQATPSLDAAGTYPKELSYRPPCTRVVSDPSFGAREAYPDLGEAAADLTRFFEGELTVGPPQGCSGPHLCKPSDDRCAVVPAITDVFKARLFANDPKPAILQLRVQQSHYLLAFFYPGTVEHTVGHPNDQGGMDAEYILDSGWHQTPGILLVGTEDYPTCVPEKCPGYFCFDLTELRAKGEVAIVGRTCNRVGEDEVEALTLWQVTRYGPRELAAATLRRTSRTAGKVQERRWTYEFTDGFPKRLLLREKLGRGRLGPPMELPLAFAD